MEKAITPYLVRFRLWGMDYQIPSTRVYSESEFNQWLFFARRLICYVMAPRFCLIRLYLSEVEEVMRKKGIYKHKVKQAAKALKAELDRLELRHRRRINEDFMEVMTNAMAGKGLAKTNELRGAMGGAMMRCGVRNYIFYSYPYTVLELLYDTKDMYAACMYKVQKACGIDFTPAFMDFCGENAYMLSYKLMCACEEAIGERIPRIDPEVSGAVEKLNSLARILTDLENLHDAYNEAADEVEGELPADVKMLDVWQHEEQEATDRLKSKYKVSKL